MTNITLWIVSRITYYPLEKERHRKKEEDMVKGHGRRKSGYFGHTSVIKGLWSFIVSHMTHKYHEILARYCVNNCGINA